MKNSFLKYIFLTFLFLFFPAATFAQVVINEVQLLPTDLRFVELYNTSDSDIDLTGWYIQRKTETGSSFGSFVSSTKFENKIIGARGYFLISKNSNSDIVTTLTLTESNTLQIKDSKGNVINKIGWGNSSDCGGSCAPNPAEGQSIQRTASGWIAASPTPGATNESFGGTQGEILDSSDESESSDKSSLTNVSSLSAQLDVQAGSDRATSPGSPIWFQATIKKNTTKANVDLNWSFGDGNVGVGNLVSHTYKYSGDYVVVLSAKAGEIYSVSRFKVKVAAPDIIVSDGGEYLEILNKSSGEVNLFNWKLESEGKAYIFQPNTIILPKSSIKIDKSILSIKDYGISLGISLKNSLGEEIFFTEPIREVNLEEISKKIEVIKNETVVIKEKAESLGFIPTLGSQQANAFSAVSTIESEEPDLIDLPQPVIDTDNVIYEAPKRVSFVAKLTNFIKRVFSN